MGIAASFATARFTGSPRHIDSFVWAAMLMGAAWLFTRKQATAQALARAAAWSVILPTALATSLLVTHLSHVNLSMLVPSAAAAIALVLTRPLLHTEEARATFAPVAMRGWFLASAVGAIGVGLAATELATEFAGAHLLPDALALGALGVSLFASGIGVMRMRAWGVVLGLLSSVLALFSALHFEWFMGWPIHATALPGVMMTVAVLAARAGLGHPKRVPYPVFASKSQVAEPSTDPQAGRRKVIAPRHQLPAIVLEPPSQRLVNDEIRAHR
jgi:hypothetical protein